MNQILKQGVSGYLVEVLQLKLGLPSNGVFDENLKNKIKVFQTDSGLKPDGVVGYMTWNALDLNPEEIYADTDTNSSAAWVRPYLLPEGEYVKQPTTKKWIVLHANHGLYDPYKQIDTWAKDQRGRVGSNYVIGGPNPNIASDSNEVDGKILQAIKDLYWGYHIGPVKNPMIQSNSISIELCSAGPLDLKDNKYYTWFGLEVDPSQVATLSQPFKGHLYFHKYSQKQINSLKALLILLKDRHGIDLQSGIFSELNRTKEGAYVNGFPSNITNSPRAFEYSLKHAGTTAPGLYVHSNLSETKLDLFPQTELIEMIKSLR